jgi:PBP1b-binding outer membrane lipoprotein LpoB
MSKVMRLIAILLMGVFLSGCQRPDELMRAAANGTGQVAAGK